MKNCSDCGSTGGKKTSPAKKQDPKKAAKPVRTFPAMTLTTKGSLR